MRFGRNNFTADASKRRWGQRAFTLVEILIVVMILGILATIVVPQMSNASKEAKENTLKDDLRYIRTQIAVFRAQHHDVSPGYPNGKPSNAPTEQDFLDQMSKFSNDKAGTNATASASFPFGPYLQRMPENPLNGKSKIKIIGNAAAMGTPNAADELTYGWIYKPATQEIIACSTGTDASGQAYSSY
jgi:prepilin-type N-terminal cleavage/methylation domain-containing protein